MTKQHDVLARELTILEAQCSAQHIPSFYGQVPKCKATKVFWRDPTPEHLEAYVAALLKAAPALLIIEQDRYVHDTSSAVQELLDDYKNHQTEEKRQAFDESFDQLRLHDGELLSYTLSFFKEGVCYIFERDADWREHFETLLDAYDFDGEDVMNAGDAEEKTSDSLTEVEETLIETLIHDPAYHKAGRYSARMHLVREQLHQKGITDENRLIMVAAEAHDRFTCTVLPQREADERRQVQELKSEGKTKTEIQGRLGLSATQLNRYWY